MRVVERAAISGVAVGEVDVGPDRAVGAGDAGRVAEARPGGAAAARRRRRSPCAGGLRDQHVGEHVRQVGDAGHAAGRATSASIAAGGRRSAASDAVQALVEHAGGAGGGRQVPGRPVEQVGAGVLALRRSRRPRAGGRRRSAGVRGARGDHARLVEPTSVTTQSGRRGRERLVDERRAARRPARRRTRARRRPPRRPRSRRERVDRAAARAPRLEHAGVGVVAADLGVQPLTRGQADRAADQTRRPMTRRASCAVQTSAERLAGKRRRRARPGAA